MIVSIIIPTCNRTNFLRECLRSLMPQLLTSIQSQFEVIVTDDGHTHETTQMIATEYPNVKWIKGPQKGPAANRNFGALSASGTWLLFLDDDCIPAENLLANYLHYIHEHKQVSVIEGCILPLGKRNALNEESPINTSGNLWWSCNLMVRKEVFLQEQGFDESFPFAAMEDVDFRERLKPNYPAVFAQEAIVYHSWRLVVNSWEKYQRAYQSHKVYFQKNKHWQLLFPFWQQFSNFFRSILFSTVPNLVKFGGRGWQHLLAYHWFQIKLLFLIARMKRKK